LGSHAATGFRFSFNRRQEKPFFEAKNKSLLKTLLVRVSLEILNLSSSETRTSGDFNKELFFLVASRVVMCPKLGRLYWVLGPRNFFATVSHDKKSEK
jgi:hypothetical protein